MELVPFEKEKEMPEPSLLHMSTQREPASQEESSYQKPNPARTLTLDFSACRTVKKNVSF